MTVRDELVPLLEVARAYPGELGLRPYAVTVRRRVWSGERPGVGELVDTDTRLLVGGQNPKVRGLSLREVFASGGLYLAGDFEIAPLMPDDVDKLFGSYEGPGSSELFVHLAGPGLAPGGVWCALVERTSYAPALRGRIVVRSLGVATP